MITRASNDGRLIEIVFVSYGCFEGRDVHEKDDTTYQSLGPPSRRQGVVMTGCGDQGHCFHAL